MKKTILKSYLMAAFVLLGALTFVACGDDTNEDGKVLTWSDYVSMDIQRCERIGSSLYIEYTLTNITDRTLDATSHLASENRGAVADNLGNMYPIDACVWDNEVIWRQGHSVTLSDILPQQKRSVRCRVDNFDPTNRAAKVEIRFNIDISDVYDLDNSLCQKRDIPVADNRVMDNGIQTNDFGLAYQVNSCEADAEGNVVIDFAVNNSTQVGISEYRLDGIEASDDRNNHYQDILWAVSDSEEYYEYLPYSDIPRGHTLHARVMVKNVSPQAATITLEARNTTSSDTFYPTCETLRFLTIAIER